MGMVIVVVDIDLLVLSLGNNLDDGADVGPVVDDFCISFGHVDAAMAHGSTKIIVPVRAVYAVVSVEIHGELHIWQIICVATCTTRHGSCG